MKKMRIFIIFFLLLVILLFTSCRILRDKNDDSYWFTDERGTITTNDIQRLKSQIPFDIVLPEYPKDFNNDADTRYHFSGTNESIFMLEHYSDNYTKGIEIEEEMIPMNTHIVLEDNPDSETDHLLAVNGIRVMFDVWEMGREDETFDLLKYQWCNDGIWFHTFFTGYNDEESLKIVESIIDQTSQPTWLEYSGMFNTKDITRAQMIVPFKILLPTYLPYNQQDTNIPDIEGDLKEFQDDDPVRVSITYNIKKLDNSFGFITISELNYAIPVEFPEPPPYAETITIANMTILKTNDNFGDGNTCEYRFKLNGTYFILKSSYLPSNEVNKVISSIIDQIE